MAQRVENAARDPLVPGTEILLDGSPTHDAKATVDHFLVPRPSDNPHDPLVRPTLQPLNLRPGEPKTDE